MPAPKFQKRVSNHLNLRSGCEVPHTARLHQRALLIEEASIRKVHHGIPAVGSGGGLETKVISTLWRTA
jgi:hypothetical protein